MKAKFFVLLAVLVLVLAQLACVDTLDNPCAGGPTNCTSAELNPASAVMGEKNVIENAVESLVCGDGTCDNTLSGGNK